MLLSVIEYPHTHTHTHTYTHTHTHTHRLMGLRSCSQTPLEIVKIRLQVAGEMADTACVGAVQVVKELGFMGLYKVGVECTRWVWPV